MYGKCEEGSLPDNSVPILEAAALRLSAGRTQRTDCIDAA